MDPMESVGTSARRRFPWMSTDFHRSHGICRNQRIWSVSIDSSRFQWIPSDLYEPAQGYAFNGIRWIPMDSMESVRTSARVRFQWIPIDSYGFAKNLYEPSQWYGFNTFLLVPMDLLTICTSQRKVTVAIYPYGFLWIC